MLTAPSGPHHRDLGRRPGEVEVGADVLRAHDVVRAAVRLARDHRQLRHRRLGVGVEELRAVADDPAPLLRGAGQEAGHVDEGDERDVERVARADEARRLDRRVDVEHAGERARLVADDADRVAAEPREAADDVLGEALVHLEELAVVDDLRDHLLHVVRLVRLVGDERVELGRLAVDGIGRRGVRRRLEVVLRQEREQVARVLEARPPRRARRSARRPTSAACVAAPPSSSNVTSSPVTVFTTSGPVMNMYDVALDHEARSR